MAGKRKYRGHDARRNQILDGAWKLFTTLGYEGTTVAAILDCVGISKGLFYHYFASKEEVLDAVTDRLSAEPLDEMAGIVDDPTLDAREKLDRFSSAASHWRLRRMDAVLPVARVLHREENLIIRHKISTRLRSACLPLLSDIFAQGIREGRYLVSDVESAAYLVWEVWSALAGLQMDTLCSDALVEAKVDALVKHAEFFAGSIERILGAEPGTLTVPPPQFFHRFAEAVAKNGNVATPTGGWFAGDIV